MCSEFNLSEFEVIRVLSSNTNRKSINLLGTCADTPAIVLLEKQAFCETDFTGDESTSAFFKKVTLTQLFTNDIYGNYLLTQEDPSLNKIKATVIFPATAKHIDKFSTQDIHILYETPELYRDVTLKHLHKSQFSLEWVYNILDHRKEVERIIFEDPNDKVGFILLPDLKWDGSTLETLYCIAIVRKRGIKSLRDLTDKHLPLLVNILKKGTTALAEKFDVSSSQLRMYIHYQPSFYHLHVHFTYLGHEAPGIFCEKSHLLSTVIDNLKLMPQYYKKATIPFLLEEADPMYEDFQAEIEASEEAGSLRKRRKLTEDTD